MPDLAEKDAARLVKSQEFQLRANSNEQVPNNVEPALQAAGEEANQIAANAPLSDNGKKPA